MRKLQIFPITVLFCFVLGCSPRDFLTRRLAADLIAGSDTFKTTQQFEFRIGIIPNKDYISPEYMVMQRRGWITASTAPCGPVVGTPPCWDVVLTPLGVETLRDLVSNSTAATQDFKVAVVRRDLVTVTGISKSGGDVADVDFQWRWFPMNEIGAALYTGGVSYNSTVGFRRFDDGWRLMEGKPPKSNQNLEEALENAEPAQ